MLKTKNYSAKLQKGKKWSKLGPSELKAAARVAHE